MPQPNGDELEAKEEALEAWSQLPQSKPSKEALPPAGGGLEFFFGLFLNLFERIRTHKILSLVIIGLVILAIVWFSLWQ